MRPARSGSAYLDARGAARDVRRLGRRSARLCADVEALRRSDRRHAKLRRCRRHFDAPRCEELPALLATIADRAPHAPPVPATRPSGRHLVRLCGHRGWPGAFAPRRDAGPKPAAARIPVRAGLVGAAVRPDRRAGERPSRSSRRTISAMATARSRGGTSTSRCWRATRVQLADRLGLARFDLWGTHTGALVALELALSAPDRVGRARARSAAAAAGRLLAGHSGELPAAARSRQMGPARAAGLEHAARHVPVLAVVPAAKRRRAAAWPARRCHAA